MGIEYDHFESSVSSIYSLDDDMIIEAEDDTDDDTTESYMLPNGIGVLALNLPVARRYGQQLFNEDDEVIVIERDDRPRLLSGAVDTWFRGRAEPQTKRTTSSNKHMVGRYAFDNDDDPATELVDNPYRKNSKFQESPARLYRNLSLESEDNEIIIENITIEEDLRKTDPRSSFRDYLSSSNNSNYSPNNNTKSSNVGWGEDQSPTNVSTIYPESDLYRDEPVAKLAKDPFDKGLFHSNDFDSKRISNTSEHSSSETRVMISQSINDLSVKATSKVRGSAASSDVSSTILNKNRHYFQNIAKKEPASVFQYALVVILVILAGILAYSMF